MEKTYYDYFTYIKKDQLNPQWIDDYEKIRAIENNCCNRCHCRVEDDKCMSCKELGILTKSDYLYRLKQDDLEIEYVGYLKPVSLTKLQHEASNFIIKQIQLKQNILIWAVCGAGKTEITFEAIDYVLKQNKIVCFCIPRVDILYEIAERLKTFFVDVDVAIINGEIKEKKNSQIFVMTTNQLLRYKNIFDLVIVDEVDAFPFSSDPKFLNAIPYSLTETGVFCCLTSTPSKDIKSLDLKTFIIYQRWHGNLLPVPKTKLMINKFQYKIFLFNKILSRKRQILIFVCDKRKCQLVKEYLEKKIFNIDVEYVHSQRKKRRNIIENFAKEKIDILITTPILERGVTFKNIDVIVLDADNDLYNDASLIQIAGRCGRHKDYQDGKIYFCYKNYTKLIKKAIKQIKYMNKLAKKKS